MNDASGPVERWLPVPGFEGAYEVSDQGRVRSCERRARTAQGTRRVPGRVLKPGRNKAVDGYLYVQLWADNVQYPRLIHRLVAEAFLGPCPSGQEVRHGPDGMLDNRLGNLSYGTRSDNMFDRRRDGTDHELNKTVCPRKHLLLLPNLIAALLPGRGCLACDRGRATVQYARDQHGILLDLQAESDRHYARIMGSDHGVGTGTSA